MRRCGRAGVPEEPAGPAADGGAARRVAQGARPAGRAGQDGARQTVSPPPRSPGTLALKLCPGHSHSSPHLMCIVIISVVFGFFLSSRTLYVFVSISFVSVRPLLYCIFVSFLFYRREKVDVFLVFFFLMLNANYVL